MRPADRFSACAPAWSEFRRDLRSTTQTPTRAANARTNANVRWIPCPHHKRNLLEARMIVTTYNQHVRLLSSEPFGWFAPPKSTRAWEPTLFMESLHSESLGMGFERNLPAYVNFGVRLHFAGFKESVDMWKKRRICRRFDGRLKLGHFMRQLGRIRTRKANFSVESSDRPSATASFGRSHRHADATAQQIWSPVRRYFVSRHMPKERLTARVASGR